MLIDIAMTSQHIISGFIFIEQGIDHFIVELVWQVMCNVSCVLAIHIQTTYWFTVD